MPRVRPFALSPVLALAMLLPVAVATSVHAQDASPEAAAGAWVGQEPDLAAMPVTPADMEELGFPGFGRLFNGFFPSFDFFAETDAEFWGKSLVETRAFYERIGWSRFYAAPMGLPSVPGEDSPPARFARSTVLEVADAAGADDYLTYISSAGPEGDGVYEYFEAPFALGDRAVFVNVSFYDPEAAETRVELNVFFQLGNLIGKSAFATDVPDDAGTPAASPAATPMGGGSAFTSAAGTMEELELLGRRHLENMEAVLADGGPNLPALMLRLGDDPFAVSTVYGEAYRLLDGELLPYYLFEDDILADPAAVTGAEAVYELEELFLVGEEESPDDHYFLNRLYQFPDEETAVEFIASRPDALETGGFRLATGATEEAGSELLADEATDLGDESLAFSFVRAFDDGSRNEGYEVFVRVGAMVAAVSLEGPPDLLLEQVTEIAAAQAACLEAGACPDALPVPEDWLTAPEGTPTAATPDA